MCRHLRDSYNIAVVTNDIFTKEDCDFLTRNEALPAERISCLETGGCPHAAIREDISGNVVKLEELTEKFDPGKVSVLGVECALFCVGFMVQFQNIAKKFGPH